MDLTDDSSGMAMMIAKFAILLVIGITILNGIGANNLLSSTTSVQIGLAGQPSDGDTLTLDGVVYEFHDTDIPGGVVAEHTQVSIGLTIDATQTNLQAAIAAHYGVS